MHSRFETVKQFLHDILLEFPASSVEVEKAHANLQRDVHTYGGNSKFPQTIQRDSYLMSTVLEHQKIKQCMKERCFGESKGKVRRLLRKRCAESSELKVSLGNAREGISAAGSVKRYRGGMLKGLLSTWLANSVSIFLSPFLVTKKTCNQHHE